MTRLSSHPLIAVICFGLILRLIVSLLFTYPYDSSYWGLVFENIQSGNGLYDLPGYYYTPIWGYVIATLGSIADLLFGVDVLGTHAYEFIFLNETAWNYYKDLVPSMEFSMILKVFLTVVDLLASYLLYVLVLNHTGDGRKAMTAFSLWFLCPLAIYTSCVQVMFDGIAVLMILLLVYFIFNGKMLFAGMAFCIAVLTKIFPAYLIFILVAYLIAKNRPDLRAAWKNIGMAVIGTISMFILVYLPVILNGDFFQSLNLFTSRSGGSADYETFWEYLSSNGFTIVLLLQPLVFALILWLSTRMARYKGEDLNGTFIFLSMLVTASIFLWTPTPTYLMVVFPFLIMHVVSRDSKYRVSYLLLSIVPVLYSLSMHNFSILVSSSIFFDLVDWSTIHNGIMWFDQNLFMTLTNQDVINLIMGAAETLSIYSIFMILIIDHRKRRGMNVEVF